MVLSTAASRAFSSVRSNTVSFLRSSRSLACWIASRGVAPRSTSLRRKPLTSRMITGHSLRRSVASTQRRLLCRPDFSEALRQKFHSLGCLHGVDGHSHRALGQDVIAPRRDQPCRQRRTVDERAQVALTPHVVDDEQAFSLG